LIRDRGSKKWVSMMLPEHVELLRKYDEGLNKSSKPYLDEQQYNEFNELVVGAMEGNHTLKFSYYERGDIQNFVGNVHYIDEMRKELRIIDLNGSKQFLKLENIIGITNYQE
jgi:hypothetical protein